VCHGFRLIILTNIEKASFIEADEAVANIGSSLKPNHHKQL